MLSREFSTSSSNRSGSAHTNTSGAKSPSQEKSYEPSGSTTMPSSHRTSGSKKVVILYPSSHKDPDRRSKFQDSGYYP